MTSAPLHGPGGLLATPGLGGVRKRKWGKRVKSACTCGVVTKAGEPGEHIAPGVTRIRGNLCNVHGKYGPCDAGAAKPKKGRARKPKAAAKPKKVALTPEQRAADRATQRAQAQTDTLSKMNIAPDGQAALLALRKGEQPDPAAIARGGFEDAGLVERAGDGSYRLTASGRAALSASQSGDAGRTGDTISSARDRVGARKQRQQAAVDRKQQAAQRQAAQRQAARVQRRASKKQPNTATAAQPVATVPRASAATKRHAMPRAGARVQAPKGTTPAKATSAPTQIAPALRDAAAKLSDGSASDADVQVLVRNGLAKMNKDGDPVLTAAGLRATQKSFTVYKDHTGRPRWIARTTTAYKDRDDEIISEAALDADSARMTATKAFGPLRWWHVGTPDPLNDDAPWGMGLDIGDCDYSALIGRTRVESGTFRSPAIAEKVARAADSLEMSPGFFHPLDQPHGGVFSSIRTFERSLVPTRYARASNLFTGFTVKECSMEIPEMERRFKAMYQELGLTPEQGVALGQQLVATEKTAQAQGIAFKSAADVPETIVVNGVIYKATLPPEEDMSYAIPQEVTINGVVYKAFPPVKAEPAADPGMTSVEEKAPPVDDTTVDVMADPAEPEMEYDAIGDMSRDEFTAFMGELLAPVLKMQDMVKSIGDAHQELKGMYGGMAAKEASEIAALKTRLAELEGRQPATILPDEVEAALKSAGPAKPAEPAKPSSVNVNDPMRPWAGWGAQTWPELYEEKPQA